MERLSRGMLRKTMRNLQLGQMVLEQGSESERFGDLSQVALAGHVRVLSPRFYRRILSDGVLGAAESYLEGEWVSDELTDVFRVLLKNEHVIAKFSSSLTWLSNLRHRLQHFRNRNSREGSRRNIHEHYDLGNSFFSLFLDPTMMYSSAIFADEQTSLEEASLEKVDRACRQLQLQPTDDLIEIGTGWGTLAIHAATRYGCRVTTTTISDEQYRMATQRVSDAGLSDRVTVLKRDYRDLTGQFDKLVSIEMIEAVGRRYLPGYFEKCSQLLKDDGAMLIQAITLPEQRYAGYEESVDFIQKYIFPGGFLPSISMMQQFVAEKTNLRMLALDDFGMHYARTLRLWNERFHEQLDAVRGLGFDDRFIRMWRYYLCYCEAAFLERAIGLVQVLWAKPASPLGNAWH
ncbi:MAG: Cyclopropane-fatty-acyl-phospholipid synthase [Planctomycetota bacterium]|jgi:cyclopropane-fatty-acyl-phospholipid synthase